MFRRSSCWGAEVTGARYLSLARAGAFARGGTPNAASARWARRLLLPHIPHYHLPGTGPVVKVEDIDTYLEKFRREPANVTGLIHEILTPH